MAGYYTTSRTRPYSVGFYDLIDAPGVPWVTYSVPRLQTTTSFRSDSSAALKGGSTQTVAEFLSSAKVGSKWAGGIFGVSDTGHEFQTQKEEFSLSHPSQYIADGNGHLLKVPLIPGLSGRELAQPQGIPDLNLGYWGPKAFNDSVPTKPKAGINQLIGEIDQIPRLGIKTFSDFPRRADFFRNLGDDWLNAKFGWVPFLSDIQKLMKSVLKSSEVIDQYFKDSKKPIHRRRFYLQDPVTSFYETAPAINSLHYISPADHPFYTGFYEPGFTSGITSQTITVQEKFWFTGSFTYFAGQVAESADPLEKIHTYENLANQIVGSRMTPDLLWELAPWSWLVDWFVDIGTITNNAVLLSEDSLVLRYGYLMRTTLVQNTISVKGLKFKSFNPGFISSSYALTRKERVKATPFGFGLNPNSFSDQQWAILAALGLTKGPRSLRTS